MNNDLGRERVIHRILERQAETNGDRVFLYHKGEEFTFRFLDESANRLASGLQTLGVVKGDKIAIMLDNCPEYLFLIFGLLKIGAIEVPINTAHKGDLLAYMLRQSDSKAIVVDSKYLDRVQAILENLPDLQRIIILGSARTGKPELSRETIGWSEMCENNGRYNKAEVLWSDPFAILYTSGTTGASKGSLLPHNHAVSLGEIVCESAEYTPRDCLYCALPLFHGNGQVLSTIPALMSGARLVLAERFSVSNFWDDIRKYGCTEFNFLGGILGFLLSAEPKPSDADNSLRLLFGGGSPRSIVEAFEKRFEVTTIEAYGMSEIGFPIMSTSTKRRTGSCGKVHDSFQVTIVDDNGIEVGPNTPGELLARPTQPHSILLEYYKMPEKTVEAWRGLWFHTGDYLYYDEDGYFYFIDRKKDALRRHGENISSHEVEVTINSHPSVAESAAIAVKSDLGEDEVMVCLRLNDGSLLKPEELIAYCEERMAYFMIPRYLRFMTVFPRTPTERVQKFRLREEGVTPDTWDRVAAGYKLKR